MKKGKLKKIALACSAGGHFMEMRQLGPVYERYDYFFVTEDSAMTRVIAQHEKVYLLRLANRRMWNVGFLLLWNTLVSLVCLLRERPHAVVCTGALSTVPICILAKLAGIKLVFIESFCKVHTPTLSGKIVYKFADLFLVQWESMLIPYPKAQFAGGVY